MGKKFDLVVKVGEYTDGQGQTKGRFKNVGVMMDGDKGPYILLDRTFNPAGVGGNEGRESIIVSLYEPKDGVGQQQAPAAKSGGQQPKWRDLEEDSVPF
jgi:hypothetical protein